jgi:hypothetical protein
MSKIIGNTVGTPISPNKVVEKADVEIPEIPEIDEVVTEGSTNLITSGAVYDFFYNGLEDDESSGDDYEGSLGGGATINPSTGLNVHGVVVGMTQQEFVPESDPDITDPARTYPISSVAMEKYVDERLEGFEGGSGVNEIPESPKDGGAYELHVHILDDKKIYYWEEIKESTRMFYKYSSIEKGILSPNDMFTCDHIATMAYQDGAFYKGLLYKNASNGTVAVVEPKQGQIIAEYEHEKVNMLRPHANSVFIVERNGVPYMYSNIYNNYSSAENRHIGECCVYKSYEYLSKLEFISGGLNSATGDWTVGNSRQVTEYLDVNPLSTIKSSNAQIIVSCYDSNKNYLGQFTKTQDSLIKNSGQWFTTNTEINIKTLKSINENVEYVRLLCNFGVETIPNVSITYDNDITDTLVQLLKVGFVDNPELWWVTNNTGARIFGNFIADDKNGFLYVYVIDNDNNVTKWHKFYLPKITDGEYDPDYGCLVFTLEEEDIIESWTTDYFAYPQGCCCYDNKLWVTYGGGVNASGVGYARMVVIDLTTKTVIATIDFADAGITDEPEGVDFYKGDCYYNSMNNLYKIKFV